MTSSSEALAPADLARLEIPELRIGEWTRLGGRAVLGDAVTESVLGGIAAEARSAAQARGYAAGWAEGRRAAAAAAVDEEAARSAAAAAQEVRREAEHRAAVDALGRAAEEVRGLLDGLTAAIEQQVTELAWALATEVVGAAVSTLGPADVVARVLQVLPPAPVGRVRLHPGVVSSMSPALAELTSRGLELVPDPLLGPGDALVETPDGGVTDLRIDEAMARVREVLR